MRTSSTSIKPSALDLKDVTCRAESEKGPAPRQLGNRFGDL